MSAARWVRLAVLRVGAAIGLQFKSAGRAWASVWRAMVLRKRRRLRGRVCRCCSPPQVPGSGELGPAQGTWLLSMHSGQLPHALPLTWRRRPQTAGCWA